jgi:hypothetical protein
MVKKLRKKLPSKLLLLLPQMLLLLHQKLPPFSNLKMKEIAKQLSM